MLMQIPFTLRRPPCLNSMLPFLLMFWLSAARIGGLCAAIASAQSGAKTLVAEKADTRRSGSGATGNDHFACYYPKAHGDDIKVILKELRQSMVGAFHDEKLSLRFLEESLPMVNRWYEWGINMKPFSDDYEFMGHAYPDRPRIWLKYDGHNQKQVLTRQARKEGVDIVNHMPVVELIKVDGEIAGALALDVSEISPASPSFVPRRLFLPPVPRTVCILLPVLPAGPSIRHSALPAQVQPRLSPGVSVPSS